MLYVVVEVYQSMYNWLGGLFDLSSYDICYMLYNSTLSIAIEVHGDFMFCFFFFPPNVGMYYWYLEILHMPYATAQCVVCHIL